MKFEVFGPYSSTKKEGYVDSDHYKLSERLKLKLRRNQIVFTITNALKQILIENGVQESKIRVLPNAVDASKRLSGQR